MWQNSKTKIVTKLKNSKDYKTQELKMEQNSNSDKAKKNYILTKLKHANGGKTKKN